MGYSCRVTARHALDGIGQNADAARVGTFRMTTMITSLTRLMVVGAAMGICALAAAAGAAETSSTSEVRLPLRLEAGGKPLKLHESTVQTSGGKTATFTRVEFLVSGIKLKSVGGEWVELRDQFFHIDPAEKEPAMVLKNVPDGPIEAVGFVVGVEPKINHEDPAKWPAGHALNVLESNLHWGWANGYVFLAVEGYVAGAEGTRANFVYHIGNEENLMRPEVKVAGGLSLSDAELVVHVDRIWSGKTDVEPGAEKGLTHSAKGDTLAPRLARNFEQAFEVRRRGK